MARIEGGRRESTFEKTRKEKRGTAESERKRERMRVRGTKRCKEVKCRDEKCGETDKTNYFILRAHIQKSILDPEFRNCRRVEPSSSSSSYWLVPAISAKLEEKGSIKHCCERNSRAGRRELRIPYAVDSSCCVSSILPIMEEGMWRHIYIYI